MQLTAAAASEADVLDVNAAEEEEEEAWCVCELVADWLSSQLPPLPLDEDGLSSVRLRRW